MVEYGKISAGFDHGGDYTGELLDFSADVSPLGVPEPVREALRDLLSGDDLTRYPDPTSWLLCRRIGIAEGLEVSKWSLKRQFLDAEDYVLCGNGAADLIFRAVWAIRPKTALLIEPTFSEYGKSLAQVGCDVRSFDLSAGNGFRLTEEILSALTPDLDMVFLCSPNNPTAVSVPADLLEQIARTCQENGTVFFWDACFMDFSTARPTYQALMQKLVRKYDMVYVLKSFTKLYALPGIRIGYLMSCNTQMLNRMLTAGAPWSVSAAAQTAGVAALRCNDYVDEVLALNAREKATFYGALKAMGFAEAPTEGKRLYVPSDANFLLLRTERADLAAVLEEDYRIKVRDCRSFQGLDGNWIRISIRDMKDNSRLIAALREVL